MILCYALLKGLRGELRTDPQYRLPHLREEDVVQGRNAGFRELLMRDPKAYFFFMLVGTRLEHPFCGVAHYNMLDT